MEPDDTNAGVADAAAGVDAGVDTSTQQDTGGAPGINPAWNDLLGVMPSSLHSQMIPHLQKWDQGVQQRFQQVQSQYAPYEPYKQLIEQQVDPTEVGASLQLARMIAENPREFYTKMGEYYGKEWGLDQGRVEVEDGDDYSLDGFDQEPLNLEDNPYLKQIKEQQDMIATVLAAQLEEKQQAQQTQMQQEMDQKVESDLATISEKYGELSPQLSKMIISVALADPNQDLMAAAEQVFAVTGQAAAPAAPRIMSPGGGVPVTTSDIAGLDRKSTRNLVAQYLQAAREGQ